MDSGLGTTAGPPNADAGKAWLWWKVLGALLVSKQSLTLTRNQEREGRETQEEVLHIGCPGSRNKHGI